MQPYFYPYAGYFRLFAAADLFVVYDCVQFPRRGWVHRNRLPDASGKPGWLTLPLEKAPRATKISDLRFPADAIQRLEEQMRRFPALDAEPAEQPLLRGLTALAGTTPVEYLERGLGEICAVLGLACELTRSSGLAIPAEIRGQERILAIAEAVGADHYVNAPGGEALYEPNEFARRGIGLNILKPYRGPSWSILQRLTDEPASRLEEEIESQI